ncbi:MAG: VCBS repeat-containing protein, partial [Planctomycetales bacterium]|nr:VCBS repeat-containing protein [Planctomycetales bacterium]
MNQKTNDRFNRAFEGLESRRLLTGLGYVFHNLERTASPGQVAAVDFDNDGDLDLFKSGFGASWREYTGLPGSDIFGTPHAIDVASVRGQRTTALLDDFDADGDIDVISASGNEVFLTSNEGDGRFAHKQLLFEWPGERPQFRLLSLAHLNADKNVDLVFQVWGEPRQFFILSDGVREYSLDEVQFTEAQNAYLDIDGDGIADRIDGLLGWSRNLGDASFENEWRPETGTPHDYDSDGDVDFIRVDDVLVNDGNGQFTPLTLTREEKRCVWPANFCTDVNDDGLQDALFTSVREGGDGGGAIFLNVSTPGGRFEQRLIDASNIDLHFVVNDFSGDGKQDLVFSDAYTGKLTLHDNFITPIPIANDSLFFSRSKSLEDLDNDGDLDIVLASSRFAGFQRREGQVRWYENLGDMQFSEGRILASVVDGSLDVSGIAVDVADIDSDGRLDIVWALGNQSPQ